MSADKTWNLWGCHGVPHKPSQFVDSQASLSVCLVQLLALTTPFLVMHKNCSCSIMMTNKDSLSHMACKRTDTVFSNLRNKFFQIAPLAFSIFDKFSSFHSFFPSFRILILFTTCAAKRGSQLSNGLSSSIRTLVFCSAEIRRVLHCRFTSLTAISTRPFAT